MPRPRYVGVLWTVGLMLFLAACAQSAPAPSPAPAPAPGGGEQAKPDQPRRGGMITRDAGASSFTGLDPAMGQISYQVWPIIGEYMLRRQPEDFKIVPAAIEKWDFSDGGKTLTLKVRQGVKFHNKPPVNGREMEAKDIVYTLKSLTGQLYPQLPSVRFPGKSNFDEMVDAVAVDKYTVKVTLKNPSATFLDGLAEFRRGIVLPDGLREAFGGVDSLVEPSPERYISAGPFMIKKFTQLVEVEYERNPDYYEMAADGKPKPYLDKIRDLFIADLGTSDAAFVAGQIDYVQSIDSERRANMMANRKDTVLVRFAPETCWNRLAFNLTRKPFDDVRVRKAIALVLDPVETGEQMFGSLDGKPLWKYPGPFPWVFPEALPQEELAKMPYYEHPKSQKTLDEAKRLMTEAGFPNGINFEMIGTTGRIKDSMLMAQSQLNKVWPEMKITVKSMDNALQQQQAVKAEYDMQYYCHIHDPNAVAHMKTAYHTKGGRNYPRFSDPKMDDLLDRAGQELDLAKRTAIMREAQLYALEVWPWIPTYHNEAQSVMLPHVKGMRWGAGTRHMVWFKDTWVDKQ